MYSFLLYWFHVGSSLKYPWFPDLSHGYSHMVHFIICNCWWCNGSAGSLRGGIISNFYSLIFMEKNEVSCASSCQFSCMLLIFYRQVCPEECFLLKYWISQIRSIEMVHKRFESFPEAFVKNLVSPQTKRWWPQDSQLFITYDVAYSIFKFYICSDFFFFYMVVGQPCYVLTN